MRTPVPSVRPVRVLRVLRALRADLADVLIHEVLERRAAAP